MLINHWQTVARPTTKVYSHSLPIMDFVHHRPVLSCFDRHTVTLWLFSVEPICSFDACMWSDQTSKLIEAITWTSDVPNNQYRVLNIGTL